MMAALCMWDRLVGFAQIQQREQRKAGELSHHQEIHLLAEVLHFPPPQADTGGLVFETELKSEAPA